MPISISNAIFLYGVSYQIYTSFTFCVCIWWGVCRFYPYHLMLLPWHCLHAFWMGLTHWGRVTHICASDLTIIGSDNGLSPGRRQAIIWTNAGILLIGPLGTNFSESVIDIHIFIPENASENIVWKMAAIFLGLNVLTSDHRIQLCYISIFRWE